MTTPELCDQSRSALERGRWLCRQSTVMTDASEDMIRKSQELMNMLRDRVDPGSETAA